MQTLTGYGPRYAVENSRQFNMSNRLMFQGDERKYELCDVVPWLSQNTQAV